MRNPHLVMASELLVAGDRHEHNDEHLAELIQALPASDLEADFSGDAIRPK